MKNKKKEKIVYLLLSLCFLHGALEAKATDNDLDGVGMVKVEKAAKTAVVDPEHPEIIVTPEKGHSTEGSLRIDYVSEWTFGKVKMTQRKDDDIYYLNAEKFLNNDEVRGSYIQITDHREAANSWSLQVKQSSQFRNSVIQKKEEQELNGATFSLDKIWVNSIGDRELPTVSRDTIAFSKFDQAYTIANLEQEKGQNGTWLIVFGASSTNQSNQENTLKPELDEKGNRILDEEDGKPIYTNEAIRIKIPKSTKIYPVTYETTLTWILGAFP